MTVALLTESVDRNAFVANELLSIIVALLTESVDRNTGICKNFDQAFQVALLTESVDRNYDELERSSGRLCRSPHGERG